MSSSSSRPRAAYIEDYNEEAHTTVPETRQSANIAAKRSKPDIAKLKVAQGGAEDASDSGYSSHTVPIGSGGNSSLKPTAERNSEPKEVSKVESRARNPPLKLDTSVAMSKRKTEHAGRSSAITPKSAQKPTLRRTDSKARDGKGARQKDCSCPECMAKSRHSATPQEPSKRINYYDTARPKPEAPAPPPPSKPPPPKPVKEAPVVQPAQSRPRAKTVQSYRTARPVSFHGEPLLVQPVYIEQRPMSTFPTSLPFQPPSYPPPKPSYIPSNLQPIPRPPEPLPHRAFTYEPQPQPPARPQPRQWTSDQPPPSHQPLIYNHSPIVDYPPQLHYPAPVSLSQSLPQRLMGQYPANVPEETYPFDEDYYRMPPPPPRLNTNSKPYRPIIRHAATSVAHPTLHHDRRSIRIADIAPEHISQRSPRKGSPEKQERSKRPSAPNRPVHAPTAEKTLPYYQQPRVRVESGNSAANASAKQRRRASYYGHETPHDLERVVEAYQALKAGHLAPSPPLPPLQDISSDSLKLVRKKPHHGGSSDGGSRVSGEGRAGSRESSEVKPRSSTDRRSEIKTRTSTTPGGNENDGFTMRFNAGVSVDVKGDGVEGRTISLRPSAETEGGMELSIGARGRGGSGGNRGRDKSRRPLSYLDGGRELEYARSVDREGDGVRDREREREKDRGREREREKEKEKERERNRERDMEKERERDKERERERRLGASRSRRSSRSGYSGRGGLD